MIDDDADYDDDDDDFDDVDDVFGVAIASAKDNADTDHGWLVEPSARETRVRRKMSRNFRGSSGFLF